MPFWKPKKADPATENQGPNPASGPATPGNPVIVDIGRKELIENGFEFCGPAIATAFASAGLTITLDDQRDPPADANIDPDGMTRWLWVDEHCIIEDYGVDVEVRLADGEMMLVGALDWDLTVALRERFNDPADPERNWQYGGIDEGYLLILCRPDELQAVERRPDFEGFDTVDLTGAVEVRRTG